MKYKVFKRVTRNYKEKFSREKQTDEMHINVNGVEIHIIEQQAGYPLDKAYVHVRIPNGYGYDMDFDTFIKNATKL